MSRLGSLSLALIFAALSCGGSQTPAPTPAPESGPTAPTPLEYRAVDTITEIDLRAHVELLASDAYAGRETLTEGAEKTANYLAAQFQSYGLTPMPGKSSYKVPYTLERFSYSPEANTVSFVGPTAEKMPRALTLGNEFSPFNFSDSGEVKNADVVFAGYGITAPELGWDDYKGLKVKGKVVLVLRHTPDEKNEKSKFSNTNHGLFTTKALNAQKHGAAAMLLVTDPIHHQADDDDFASPGFVRLPATPEDTARRARRRAAMEMARKGQPKLLAVHISQEAGDAIVGDRAKKQTLKSLQQGLDAGSLKTKNVRIGAKAWVTVNAPTDGVPVKPNNVIAYLEGSDPQLKSELVVIGGHYDHLGGRSSEGRKEAGDLIYNGADDNASGTAGVLELAQAFASRKVRPARSIVFVGFSGEEKGLLGSRAMMRENQLEESKIAFMLNLDMIGRNGDKPLAVLGEAYATTIREVVEAANKDIALDIAFAGTNYSGASDHHPFFVRDIPMMFFFTGLHKDYHQLSDHADKVEYARMEKIVRLGYGVIDRVASAAIRPYFIHNLGWLGARIEIVGSAAEARATFTNIEGGSRGAKAGLAKGDIITAIDGKVLSTATEVGARFRKVEPGNTVALDIERSGTKQTISVVRAKRGFLGIFPGPVTDELRKKHGLGETEGVGIRRVTKDGPADKAGFKKDDILIRIAGVAVGNRTLGKTLARIGAGEKVAIVVIRGEERVDLTMVLGERR